MQEENKEQIVKQETMDIELSPLSVNGKITITTISMPVNLEQRTAVESSENETN